MLDNIGQQPCKEQMELIIIRLTVGNFLVLYGVGCPSIIDTYMDDIINGGLDMLGIMENITISIMEHVTIDTSGLYNAFEIVAMLIKKVGEWVGS